jgi:hypothetical protein
MPDRQTNSDQPPGFSAAEWDRALTSGRAIAVDRPPRRPRSAMLGPFAAVTWFVRLWLRSMRHQRSTADTANCQASQDELSPYRVSSPGGDSSGPRREGEH